MVVLHAFGITEGLGTQFENMTWSDLVQWPSDPGQGERPFAAREDSEGFLHVVFPRQNDLWYYSTSPSFSLGQEIIATNVGEIPRPALQISETGDLFVTFFNAGENALQLGELSPRSDSDWITETIPRPSEACSLSDCASEPYGSHSDLEIVGNSPYTVFYDQAFGNLLFSARLGGTWVGQIMDGQTPTTQSDTGDTGLWPDLVQDSNGFLSLSYYGQTASDLRYAQLTEGTPIPKQVDPGQDPVLIEGSSAVIEVAVGSFSALLPSASGQPVIFYMDSGKPGIRRAERTGSVWTLTELPLDTPGGWFLDGDTSENGERILAFQVWSRADGQNNLERRIMGWFEPSQ